MSGKVEVQPAPAQEPASQHGRRLVDLTGELNSAGSTITRVDGAGTASTFVYDRNRLAYIYVDDTGAYEKIVRNRFGEWVWRDDRSDVSGMFEVYSCLSAGGRLSGVGDFSGIVDRYAYDVHGRQIRVTSVGGDAVNHHYDKAGRLVAVVEVPARTAVEMARVCLTAFAGN